MMKYILIALFVLHSGVATAIECTSVEQAIDGSENIFLYRADEVLPDENKAIGKALKIYKGDVQTLTSIRELDINIHCDEDTPCRDLDGENYPITKGQRLLIYGDELEIFIDICASHTWPIEDIETLESLERRYPPIWVLH